MKTDDYFNKSNLKYASYTDIPITLNLNDYTIVFRANRITLQ